jgi:hypothetical protein
VLCLTVVDSSCLPGFLMAPALLLLCVRSACATLRCTIVAFLAAASVCAVHHFPGFVKSLSDVLCCDLLCWCYYFSCCRRPSSSTASLRKSLPGQLHQTSARTSKAADATANQAQQQRRWCCWCLLWSSDSNSRVACTAAGTPGRPRSAYLAVGAPECGCKAAILQQQLACPLLYLQ